MAAVPAPEPKGLGTRPCPPATGCSGDSRGLHITCASCSLHRRCCGPLSCQAPGSLLASFRPPRDPESEVGGPRVADRVQGAGTQDVRTEVWSQGSPQIPSLTVPRPRRTHLNSSEQVLLLPGFWNLPGDSRHRYGSSYSQNLHPLFFSSVSQTFYFSY